MPYLIALMILIISLDSSFAMTQMNIDYRYKCGEQNSNQGYLWKIVSDGSYIAQYIALADQGKKVATIKGNFVTDTKKYSTQDLGDFPPVEWSYSHPADVGHTHLKLKASKNNKVYATTYQRKILGSFFSDIAIKIYNDEELKYEHVVTPQYFLAGEKLNGLNVAANGRVIFWVYNTNLSKYELYIIDPYIDNFNELNFQIVAQTDFNIFGNIQQTQVSADGTRLLVATEHKYGVLDLSDLNQISFLGTTQFAAYLADAVISSDGSRIAWAESSPKKILTRTIDQQGNFSPVEEVYQLTGGESYWKIALDGEGKHLAYGFSDGQKVKIHSKNLLTQQFFPEKSVPILGSFFNGVKSLNFSDNGNHLAVGLIGDEHNQTPRLIVYKSNEQRAKKCLYLDGSVEKVEFFYPYIAVASKGTHAYVFGGGGQFTVIKLE